MCFGGGGSTTVNVPAPKPLPPAPKAPAKAAPPPPAAARPLQPINQLASSVVPAGSYSNRRSGSVGSARKRLNIGMNLGDRPMGSSRGINI